MLVTWRPRYRPTVQNLQPNKLEPTTLISPTQKARVIVSGFCRPCLSSSCIIYPFIFLACMSSSCIMYRFIFLACVSSSRIMCVSVFVACVSVMLLCLGHLGACVSVTVMSLSCICPCLRHCKVSICLWTCVYEWLPKQFSTCKAKLSDDPPAVRAQTPTHNKCAYPSRSHSLLVAPPNNCKRQRLLALHSCQSRINHEWLLALQPPMHGTTPWGIPQIPQIASYPSLGHCQPAPQRSDARVASCTACATPKGLLCLQFSWISYMASHSQDQPFPSNKHRNLHTTMRLCLACLLLCPMSMNGTAEGFLLMHAAPGELANARLVVKKQ